MLCGDFYQLPPVAPSGMTRSYCFQAQTWSDCIPPQNVVHLTRPFRQTEDRFLQYVSHNIHMPKLCVND